MNSDDCLFLNVDEERYQERNREIALARIETKPTLASKNKKLKLKKIRSEIKKSRNKSFLKYDI